MLTDTRMSRQFRRDKLPACPGGWLSTSWQLVATGLVATALALLPGRAPAQTNGYSPRLLALQQQNAFQQQQNAVQNAVQQTNILIQTAQQQNGTATSNSMSTPSTMSTSTSMPTVMVLQAPIAFQQQQ